MRLQWRLALVFVTAAVIAACSGGGGGGAGGSGGVVPVSPPTKTQNSATITIKLPQPSSSSAARHPNYISPATQSIGVVVAPQGLPTESPQYVNVASCPTVSGVVTCSTNVTVWVGNDTFTITAYSGQNGGGSALSTGSVLQTIVSGGTAPTVSVSLGGIISTIAINPLSQVLPLGQSETLNVVAKDASGAAIVGTYLTPLTLSGSGLTVSATSIPDSTTATGITISWPFGAIATPGPVTLTATGGTVQGTQVIKPGSGFQYYQTGTNPTTDYFGFKMIANGGKLYYTSGNQTTLCKPASFTYCFSPAAVHQFDPTTGHDTEVQISGGEAVGMKFTSDGALWIAGGLPATPNPPQIYRMAPGSFTAGALTAIPVPTPTPTWNVNNNFAVRSFAEDASGNLWFQDLAGFGYHSIPVAGSPPGSYLSSSITSYSFPSPPAGSPINRERARTIHFASGVLVIPDDFNGDVNVINPATPAVDTQYVSTYQTGLPNPTIDTEQYYDSTDDGTTVYLGNLGNGNVNVPNGDFQSFNPTTHAFSTLPYVQGPQGYSSTVPSVNSGNPSLVYVADYAKSSLDVVNVSNGTARSYPIAALGTPYGFFPGGVAAESDGTAWFVCYGTFTTFQPLCVAHTVYTANWGLWPGYSFGINGAGLSAGQLVGIMEDPTVNSGPFTVTSSNTGVCTVANQSNHNFVIVGVAPGSCNITVTDAHSVTQNINVTVITTSGTVQARPAAGGVK